MERAQKIEEALSIIWEQKEQGVHDRDSLLKHIVEKINENLLDDLEKEGHILIEDNSVKLTKQGEYTAKDIIRRQRLAERLLVDILELGSKEMTLSACEFEHILSKEVEESICTLLGHPRECPHGFQIPHGNCCIKAKDTLESIIIPMSKLSAGEKGRIVYISTRQHPSLHKLMSLGVIPGAEVTVHQIFPSFVIKVLETQLALEEGVAAEIHIKRVRSAKNS